MRWIEAGLGLAVLAGGLGHGSPLPAPRAAAQEPAPYRFVVVLDAAHGGSDSGARLGDGELEKSLTLRLAEELKIALRSQGTPIQVVMTRESDVDLPALNRAQIANHAEAAACLILHATATGSGVHLFTSSLAPAVMTPTLPWATAQAAYVTQSLKLESELDETLSHDAIPVTMGRASVQPMDSLACPAVAVELAPLAPGNTTQGQPISNADYDRRVVDAVAAGLAAWSNDWKP